jgi:hypothetical protein
MFDDALTRATPRQPELTRAMSFWPQLASGTRAVARVLANALGTA